MSSVHFQIVRYRDRKIVEDVTAAMGAAGAAVTKIAFRALFADTRATVTNVQDSQLQSLLASDTILIRNFGFSAEGVDVQVNRFLDGDKAGPTDDLIINTGATFSFDAGKLVSLLRASLKPLDESHIRGQLGADQKTQLLSQVAEIEHLKELQYQFFKQFTEFTKEQAKQTAADQEKLSNEQRSNRAEIDAERAKLAAERQEQDRAFKAREEEFETRESRYVRREQLRDFLNTKKEEAKAPLRIVGIPKQRTLAVLAGYIALFSYFAFQLSTDSGWDLTTLAETANDPETQKAVFWIGVAKKAFASLGCVLTLAYFVRWVNGLAHRHAERRLHEVQFGEDFLRANWLMELASEWKEVNEGPIPEYVVERLTLGLFTPQAQDIPSSTAIESLSRVIAGGKVKFADVEVALAPEKKKPTLRRKKKISS